MVFFIVKEEKYKEKKYEEKKYKKNLSIEIFNDSQAFGKPTQRR